MADEVARHESPKTLPLQAIATRAAIDGHAVVFVNPKRTRRRADIVPALRAATHRVAGSIRRSLRPDDLTRVVLQIAAVQALLAGQPIHFVNPVGGSATSTER